MGPTHSACLLVLLASACEPAQLPHRDDGGFGPGQDLGGACSGNNDGVIAFDELLFRVGLSARYLVNPPGTTATVDPLGADQGGRREWDLTSTAGDVVQLDLEPVSTAWFAPSFPGATYVTTSDLGSGTLGIFRAAPDALYLLGFASRAPNRTLLVYDQPVASLRFPVRRGDAFVAVGRIVNGTLEGQPFASQDTYRVTVADLGTAVMPFLRFEQTLRIHVELTQTLPGGVRALRQQHLFFHECYGELGRMVSPLGETSPSFTSAAEYRRLAL
jgi:hypothetical protein